MQKEDEIWKDRIETADICNENLGEPISIRNSPNVNYVYLSDYLEYCYSENPTDYLYNVVDYGDCIKCFRLKSTALLAKFYINCTLITTIKNLCANTWYEFYNGFNISNTVAPGALRYLEIEYEKKPDTSIIEISYMQMISYSKKYKKHIYLSNFGSNKGFENGSNNDK